MPSLSTTSVAVNALPTASVARASKDSAPPGPTGKVIGNVACQVPLCAEPVVRVAATLFIVSVATPTTSAACTTTTTGDAVSSASRDGDVICAVGAIESPTVIEKESEVVFPDASI